MEGSLLVEVVVRPVVAGAVVVVMAPATKRSTAPDRAAPLMRDFALWVSLLVFQRVGIVSLHLAIVTSVPKKTFVW